MNGNEVTWNDGWSMDTSGNISLTGQLIGGYYYTEFTSLETQTGSTFVSNPAAPDYDLVNTTYSIKATKIGKTVTLHFTEFKQNSERGAPYYLGTPINSTYFPANNEDMPFNIYGGGETSGLYNSVGTITITTGGVITIYNSYVLGEINDNKDYFYFAQSDVGWRGQSITYLGT